MDHIIFHSSTGGLGFSSSLDHSCPLKFQHCGFHHGIFFLFFWWTTLVSSPISPRSFIIILRFLVSHKAQCWSSSDNCCMAYELYSSTSKQFLKESLNIHLGLVAKTVLIALPVRVIYLSVLGPVFFFFLFFSGKVQVSSKWVWVYGKNNCRNNQENPRLLMLGYLGAYLNGLIVHQLTENSWSTTQLLCTYSTRV